MELLVAVSIIITLVPLMLDNVNIPSNTSPIRHQITPTHDSLDTVLPSECNANHCHDRNMTSKTIYPRVGKPPPSVDLADGHSILDLSPTGTDNTPPATPEPRAESPPPSPPDTK
ncbi:hypothetical protein CONLIGDRAFT_635473 [Coniochaeta ligniaria NRRL 30616]|uniref:Uncharacterized protein n=1 Tax=Coniochaeta ligniaria NRRL 30616 TaxID=1408157 RepID=A0A1J7IX52_9PEZI|nr:hypothetical protein CONLIGDRAFT_635473 [Coniochaeta ligniaria NRRL 30616]